MFSMLYGSRHMTRLRLASLAMTLLLCAHAGHAAAATALRFTLDRAIDGAAAPFVIASARNMFRAEDLNVTTTIANGSPDAITRVASGQTDIALADINALIRYRDTEKAEPVKAVFAVYNKAPYALIGRKSRGIATMADLQGKSIGLVDGDTTVRLWPAVAAINNVRIDKMKAEKINAAVREPMLSAGQIDAVTGYAFVSGINLRDRGVPANDLAVLRFSDFGCEVYGHALIVNPKFATENPEAVKAFVRATLAGLRQTIKEPAKAIDDVLALMSGASREVELERLRMVIADNILTDDVKKNGAGNIDPLRFVAALGQIAKDHEFRTRPGLADIFDDGFLPAVSARKIN